MDNVLALVALLHGPKKADTNTVIGHRIIAVCKKVSDMTLEEGLSIFGGASRV